MARTGGRGQNRRIITAAWKYLDKCGEMNTTEIYDHLLSRQTKSTPNPMRLGLILSSSPFFEKLGMGVQATMSNRNDKISVWRARTFDEIMERLKTSHQNIEKYPVFFKKEIKRRRGVE